LKHRLRREIGNHYGHSLLNLLEALNHDTLARVQSFFDHPEIAAALTDTNRLHMDFIVVIDNRHLEAALQF
jgi:hypothetical protein